MAENEAKNQKCIECGNNKIERNESKIELSELKIPQNKESEYYLIESRILSAEYEGSFIVIKKSIKFLDGNYHQENGYQTFEVNENYTFNTLKQPKDLVSVTMSGSDRPILGSEIVPCAKYLKTVYNGFLEKKDKDSIALGTLFIKYYHGTYTRLNEEGNPLTIKDSGSLINIIDSKNYEEILKCIERDTYNKEKEFEKEMQAEERSLEGKLSFTKQTSVGLDIPNDIISYRLGETKGLNKGIETGFINGFNEATNKYIQIKIPEPLGPEYRDFSILTVGAAFGMIASYLYKKIFRK